MTTQLLACPFCGGRALMGQRYIKNIEVTLFQVRCIAGECPVRPDALGYTEEDAAGRWNTRVPTGSAAITDAGRAALSGKPERYEVQCGDGIDGYRITNTLTDSRIATSYIRENAELIVRALNGGAL